MSLNFPQNLNIQPPEPPTQTPKNTQNLKSVLSSIMGNFFSKEIEVLCSSYFELKKMNWTRIQQIKKEFGPGKIEELRNRRLEFNRNKPALQDTDYIDPELVIRNSIADFKSKNGTTISADLENKITEKCLDNYKNANQALEMAIGDTCLAYVRENGDPKTLAPGPLLDFSRKLSQRYLDLYRCYVKWEMSQNIPMISNAAGQMKAHGLQTWDIIDLKEPCEKTIAILDRIKQEILKIYPGEIPFRSTLNTEGQKWYDLAKRAVFDLKIRDQCIKDQKSPFSHLGPALNNYDKALITLKAHEDIKIPETKTLSQWEIDLLDEADIAVGDRTLREQFIKTHKNQSSPWIQKIVAGFQLDDAREALEKGIQSGLTGFILPPNLIPEPKTMHETGKELYNEFLGILFNKKNRNDFISKNTTSGLLGSWTLAMRHYQSIGSENVEKMDHAFMMMSVFAHMKFEEIEGQFNEVANIKTDKNANEDTRLLMEIRHRIGGDGSVTQLAPGSLGQNPLAYLKAVIKDERQAVDLKNSEGEFRTQMYFAYMSNHFANTVMQHEGLIDYVNFMLANQQKDWRLDRAFITAMNERGDQSKQWLPPVFRYGSYAALNASLRTDISQEEKIKYWQDHPTPSLMEIENGTVRLDANFRYNLSEMERLNLFGDFNEKFINKNQSLYYWTGATVFHLNELSEIAGTTPMDDYARMYVKMVEKLKQPVAAGISGTLDQSTVMAMLVGIGAGNDAAKRTKELHDIKLAYLAFMVPNADHSVHEIMLSTKSYGLEYVPGPGYEKYVYPPGGALFLDQIRERQSLRQYKMPADYLTKESIEELVNQKLI